MKVKLGDREYWIEFNYAAVWVGGNLNRFVKEERDGLAREVTRCLLRDGSAPRQKDDEAPILARGEVVRYYKDAPNREVARKAALAKALADLDRTLPLPGIVPHAKELRTLFWKSYLNRKNGTAATQSGA